DAAGAARTAAAAHLRSREETLREAQQHRQDARTARGSGDGHRATAGTAHGEARQHAYAAEHAQRQQRVEPPRPVDPTTYEVSRPAVARAVDQHAGDGAARPYGTSPARRFVDAVQDRFRELFGGDRREARAYLENIAEQRRRVQEVFENHTRVGVDGKLVRAGDERRYAERQAAVARDENALRNQQLTLAKAEAEYARNARDRARDLRTQADALSPQDLKAHEYRWEATGQDNLAAAHEARARVAEDAADGHYVQATSHHYSAEQAFQRLTVLSVDLYGHQGADAWRLANGDHGRLFTDEPGPRDRSALTGTDDPPPARRLRRYDEVGGLRRVLAQHQRDLERHWPTDGHGDPVRTPRLDHAWLDRINQFGFRSDPGRRVNCNDCVRSFLDSWVHGRPTVAAPRTFDGYERAGAGEPFMGERDGAASIEDQTGGRLQSLVDDTRRLPSGDRVGAVRDGLERLRQQLLALGPGSAAAVGTVWQAGTAHIWVMVNDGGRVHFVDPQSGSFGEHLHEVFGAPRDGHAESLMRSVEGLVVDAQGRPVPLDGLHRGMHNERPLDADFEAHLPEPDRAASTAARERHQVDQFRPTVESHDRDSRHERAQERRYAADVEHERREQQRHGADEAAHARNRDTARATAARHEHLAAGYERRATELHGAGRGIEAERYDRDAAAERAHAERHGAAADRHEEQRRTAEQRYDESRSRQQHAEELRQQADAAHRQAEEAARPHRTQLDAQAARYELRATRLADEHWTRAAEYTMLRAEQSAAADLAGPGPARERAKTELARYEQLAAQHEKAGEAYAKARDETRHARNLASRANLHRSSEELHRRVSTRSQATAHEYERLRIEAEQQARTAREAAERHEEQARRFHAEDDAPRAAEQEREADQHRDLAQRYDEDAATHARDEDRTRAVADDNWHVANLDAANEEAARADARRAHDASQFSQRLADRQQLLVEQQEHDLRSRESPLRTVPESALPHRVAEDIAFHRERDVSPPPRYDISWSHEPSAPAGGPPAGGPEGHPAGEYGDHRLAGPAAEHPAGGPASERPAGRHEDHVPAGSAAEHRSALTSTERALRLLDDEDVRRALDTTIRVKSADVPARDVLGPLIRDELPRHPDLLRVLETPRRDVAPHERTLAESLRHSLLARPKTLHSLLSKPQAVDVVENAVREVEQRGAEAILAE
ncbi:MAG: toxin glutamine deamidase domain-containing protein, partial [Actinocatenispora sp.]